ncbi:DMT family transporter [Pseudostreptobacillus sp.]
MDKRVRLAELIMIVVAIIWGTGFVVTKLAMDNGIGVYYLLFIRFLVASILLMFVIFFKKIKIKKEMLLPGIIQGVLLTLGYSIQTMALNYTTPAKNSVLTGLNVIFVPYILLIFFRKKLDIFTIISSILAFFGTLLLSGNISSFSEINKGDLLSMLCAIFFALYIIVIDKYANKINVFVMSFIQFFTVMILCLLLSLTEGEIKQLNSTSLISMIYLGVFGTFVAYNLQIMAQKVLSASRTVLFLSLEVVFGVLISIISGYDSFSLNILVGTLLVFAGIVIAETKLDFIFKKEKNDE